MYLMEISMLIVTDHCLETLRLTVMCHGNTGIYSFAWDDPTSWKPIVGSRSTSVCAKWSTIEDWAYSRKVAIHPSLRARDKDVQAQQG